MNVSSSTDSFFLDVGKTIPRTASQQKGVDAYARSIEEQQKEKEDAAPHNMGLPGQESSQDRQRIESLRNQAMQIASQAHNGLSASQEAQIKDIERKIGKLSNLPMNENISNQAKKAAEENKIQQEQPIEDETMEQFQTQSEELQSGDASLTGFEGQPGMKMLHQNALVTAIKSSGIKASDFKGKSL